MSKDSKFKKLNLGDENNGQHKWDISAILVSWFE